MKKRAQETYSVTTLVLLFFLFSFAGWLWEVGYHLVDKQELVNRGVLIGPWLPIYGSGGVLILVVLKRFFDRPGLLFFLIMGICGIVEYMTGWWLETFFHTRWWDYRDMTFQIQGRVCLIGLLLFGMGGLVFVYLVAPRLNQWMAGWSRNGKELLCMILIVIFLMDFLYSMGSPNKGAGITSPVGAVEQMADATR